MRGVYKGAFALAGVSAPQVLFELTAPTNQVLELRYISVTEDNVDAGEQLRFRLSRVATAGSGGTAVTPVPMEENDKASGASLAHSHTTAPTAGTTLEESAAMNVSGWIFSPPPEEMPYVSAGGGVMLELVDTPASATNLVVTVVWREIG